MIENLSPDLKFELLVVRDGYVSAFVKPVDPAMGPARTAILRPRQAVGDPARIVRGKVVDSGGLPMRDASVKAQGILYDDPERGGHVSMYGAVATLDPIAIIRRSSQQPVARMMQAATGCFFLRASWDSRSGSRGRWVCGVRILLATGYWLLATSGYNGVHGT